jgi:hypothetical protein
MRCVKHSLGGWACARLVVTSKDMRLVEVRELVTADPEQLFNRGKKAMEEPYSVDVKQPSQLLRLELAPSDAFPLLFALVFSTPSAPSKETAWLLCAAHPATLFVIRRELRNVQRSLVVGELDPAALEAMPGFPAPVDKQASLQQAASGGGGSGQGPQQQQLPPQMQASAMASPTSMTNFFASSPKSARSP